MRPVLLSFFLRPTSCATIEASAEEQNGDVQKDLKALVVP